MSLHATSNSLFAALDTAFAPAAPAMPAEPTLVPSAAFSEAEKCAMLYDLFRRKIAALNAGAITQAQFDETNRTIERKVKEQAIPMRDFVVYCILQESPDYPVLRGDEAPF